MRLRPVLLAVSVVAICFLLYLRRPYSVVSDIGYQAFSAWQYANHQVPHFLSVQLVDPRDLARDLESPLNFWTPFWTFLFFLAFKMGLSAGTAGRVLAFLLATIGAIGWVWVVSVLRLKGRWSVAAILMAALYCLRSRSDTLLGAGDQVIYSAAPWLLGAAIRLAERMRYERTRDVARQTALLCFALGCVYWLKYSGIFLSIAIFFSLLLEYCRGSIRPRLFPALGLLCLYGTAFFLPILSLKIYNFSRSGSDTVEAAVHFNYSPPRTLERFRLLVFEAAYSASTAVFSTGQGVERIAAGFDPARDPSKPDIYGWMTRVPGLLLFPILLYLLKDYSPPYILNLAFMLIAVPFAGFPVLSFIAGDKFTFAMGRCCEPFWIFLELLALLLLSQRGKPGAPAAGMAGIGLAVIVGIQLLLFLYTPMLALPEIKRVATWPTYRVGAANLWVTDLSRWGSRDIDDEVKSMIRGPEDVIVPAVYSNRSFGMDLWIEFAGKRLLPLTTFATPLMKTHGAHGADYKSTEPFVSSRPLRVILVASDTFNDPSFGASVERMKGRFPQARSWTRGPLDADHRVEIWAADLQ